MILKKSLIVLFSQMVRISLHIEADDKDGPNDSAK